MCIPAPGDGIKVRFDEIDNTLCTYFYTVPTTSKNPKVQTSHKNNQFGKKKTPKSHKIN